MEEVRMSIKALSCSSVVVCFDDQVCTHLTFKAFLGNIIINIWPELELQTIVSVHVGAGNGT